MDSREGVFKKKKRRMKMRGFTVAENASLQRLPPLNLTLTRCCGTKKSVSFHSIDVPQSRREGRE